MDMAVWLKKLLCEIHKGEIKVKIKSDCMSLVDSLGSLRQQVQEKRLTQDLWALRQAVETKEIYSIEHIPSQLMVADGLTKPKEPLRAGLRLAMKGFACFDQDQQQRE
jgi:hypothetical protein